MEERAVFVFRGGASDVVDEDELAAQGVPQELRQPPFRIGFFGLLDATLGLRKQRLEDEGLELSLNEVRG